jgi:hypothetical protein
MSDKREFRRLKGWFPDIKADNTLYLSFLRHSFQ